VEVLDKMSEREDQSHHELMELKIRKLKQVGRALMLLLEHFNQWLK
jgi:hypothetical protein